VASFGRPKLASRVPGFHAPGLRRAAAQAATARAWGMVARFTTAAVSPTRWWGRITSVTGMAVLLGFSIVMLIAGLVVTWPRR
jgi:hypothetical protein